MATASEIKAKIATIETRLESGIVSVTADGTTTRVDLDSLRKERAKLLADLGSIEGESTRRPVASRIKLGGF